MEIVRRALSPQFIRSLRVAPKGKKVWFADDIVPGLMLRLDDQGRRTFHLSKQLGGAGEKELGEWGRMTLGQARLTARLRISSLESIESARARAKQAARFFTFAQVCNDYLEQYVIRNRSAQSARTIAMNVLIPRWGTRRCNEITRGDVVELVEEAKGRGTPNAARLQLGQVRMLYSWAISAGRYGIDDSPCDLINTQRLIAKPYHPRDRVLTDQEIVAL